MHLSSLYIKDSQGALRWRDSAGVSPESAVSFSIFHGNGNYFDATMTNSYGYYAPK